eukprot:gene16615-18951_t
MSDTDQNECYLLLDWGLIDKDSNPNYAQFHTGNPLLMGIAVTGVPGLKDVYRVNSMEDGEHAAGALRHAIPGLVTTVFTSNNLVVRR